MCENEISIERLIEVARAGALSRSMVVQLMRVAEADRGRAASVAVHLLGTVGPDASEAIPLLVDLLRAHREDKFGRTIVRALGAIGAATETVLSELRLAKHSGNKWVRKAAREAIKRIGSA
jgi:hypothetical protein